MQKKEDNFIQEYSVNNNFLQAIHFTLLINYFIIYKYITFLDYNIKGIIGFHLDKVLTRSLKVWLE